MTRPLKILEFRDADGPGGGPEKTILNSAALADRSRFEVSVCYIRPLGDEDLSIRTSAEQLGVDYLEVFQNGKFDRKVFQKVRQIVRQKRIDLVHSHDYKTDFYNLILARREGIIPLSTAHGWTGHTRRERLIYYPVEKRLLRYFPIVICVSSEIAATLLRSGVKHERICVIPNGIDPDTFRRRDDQVVEYRTKLNCNPDEIIIGSVGRLEPQKRFDLLIESFAKIHQEFPRARLMIAGEGSQRDSLQSLINRLNLTNVCRLIGHCSQVIQFYHALDLYVQSSDYEGTPNVVLEAMAMEVPIVATDAGGTTDILESNVDGLVVPVGNVDRLSESIAHCLTRPELTRQRIVSARTKVESELNFVNRVRRVEQVYETLYGNRDQYRLVTELSHLS